MDSQQGTVSIQPSFFILEIDKQQEQTIEISITNNDDSALDLTFTAAEFSQNSGNLTNEIKRLPAYEDIFNFPKGVTIDPNSSKTIEVKIKSGKIEFPIAPAIVIRADTTNTKSDTPSANFEYALPIYLKSTDIEEKISVEQLTTGKFLNINNTVKIQSNIKNDGVTFVRPEGYIEFHKIALVGDTKTRIESLPLNKKTIIILPGSNMKKEFEWQRESFGHYQATMYVYSNDSEPIEKVTDFWIVPLNLIITVSITCIALIFLTIALFRARKKRAFVRLRQNINELLKRVKIRKR